MQESKVGGAITGAVIAAAANWARYDDDTQRRLRNVRQDAEHALEVVRDIQSRGEAIRSRLPTVNDAQVGIALANSTEPTPQAVPTGGAPARPDVSSTMETAVADMSWPPQPGQYDDRGMVRLLEREGYRVVRFGNNVVDAWRTVERELMAALYPDG